MSLFVLKYQRERIAFGRDQAHAHAAFINHLHDKFRGFKNPSSRRKSSWEDDLYNAIVHELPGRLHVDRLNEAIAAFVSGWKPEAPLSGLISSSDLQQLQIGEQRLFNLVFPPALASEKMRQRHNRAVRKIAAGAVAYTEANSVELMGSELASALPEIEDDEDEDEDEDGEDGGEEQQFSGVSFGEMVMR